MNINFTYEQEFDELLSTLKEKYGEEIFELEGIGSQLDIAAFSRDFYSKTNRKDLSMSVDESANVDDKTVTVYEAEAPKPHRRLNALYLIWKGLKRYYGIDRANDIIEKQISGAIYINDLHGVQSPYCFNFSTMDIVEKGLPFVTGILSKPPKHLSSFFGQVIHFSVFASNSILGACGLADILICASYFVDKKLSRVGIDATKEYMLAEIKQEMQSFIYACNQPFRGGIQSGFYNVSLFDDMFLDQLLDEYMFPDGSFANKETVKMLQDMFIDLMNETYAISSFTFPVLTACFAIDDEKNILDNNFKKMIAEKNQDFGLINIYHGKTSTLSSCCRLRSEKDTEYFNQFGAGGTKIGSLGVVTLNLPRVALENIGNKEGLLKRIEELAWDAATINAVKRNIINTRISGGHHPLYTHGFMELKRQYATAGVTGINEMVEIMGLNILDDDGRDFVIEVLDCINNVNNLATKKYDAPHNCEQTPSESSAVKIAKKDKLLGYQSNYTLYSNQFIPLITNADMLDRIDLQGSFDSRMSGGSICHINVDTRIEDPKRIEELIDLAAKMGVIYWAVNYNLQKCENGHMSVGKDNTCAICGGGITDFYTRVVGFVVNVKNFNATRRQVDYPNRQFYEGLSAVDRGTSQECV